MYVFKNAIKNLFRNKGRNIIVAIMILTMLTFSAISMIINATTEDVIKSYKEQFGSEIYLRYDEEKLKEEERNGGWADIPELSDELKLKLSESKYLKETMIHILYPAYAKGLKGVNPDKGQTLGNGEGVPISNNAYYEANLTVHGYNTPELLKDFKEGKRKITEGKMFESDNECIVSEEFAKLNHLKVRDKIQVSDCQKSYHFDSLELVVSGIYFDSTDDKYVTSITNPRNDVLTSYETLKNYQDNIAKTKLYTVDATYYLKNPEMLNAFNQEAHQKGLHKNYKMSTDEISYNKIVKPAEGLANVSNIFLVAVLVIGSVILVLLSVLSIRERKYEIGVLRAMGMMKHKIVRGILYESLITVSICLVLGLSIGASVAQPVSDMINQNQQVQSQNNGQVQVKQEEIVISLSLDAILDVSMIAIAFTILSSSIGVLYILRYEPMKILTERN